MEDKIENNIKVSIICNTFNHEKYIRDALEGFVSQKTNFKYEILIHDDASTDHTADIIREYEKKFPEIIKPIYQIENQYSKHVPITRTFQYPRAKGKYIAFCEGDDYWTDSLKLQKQFDAMESHPEIDMCSHAADRVVGTRKYIMSPYKRVMVLTPKEVILGGGGYLATNSLLFRKSMLDDVPKFIDFYLFDYSLQIWGSLRGGILFLPDHMSVYRYSVPGSWTTRMSSDRNMRENHIHRVNKMLQILDYETEGKYSSCIAKHIAENCIDVLVSQNRFSEVRNGEYKEYFHKMSLKQKLKIYIKQFLYKRGIRR